MKATESAGLAIVKVYAESLGKIVTMAELEHRQSVELAISGFTFTSDPIAEPVEGVTLGGIRWRSTAYHGKDRRR